MSKCGLIYSSAKIYSDSEASKLNNANVKLKFNNITLLASKIIDSGSNFDEICELYIGSKQMHMVQKQKAITPAENKLEKIYVNL